MRTDIEDAVNVALGENIAAVRPRDPIHVNITPKRRSAFLARLRLFLTNCPDDLTIDELRQELQE